VSDTIKLLLTCGPHASSNNEVSSVNLKKSFYELIGCRSDAFTSYSASPTPDPWTLIAQ